MEAAATGFSLKEENSSCIWFPVSVSIVAFASPKENGSRRSCSRDRSFAISSPIKSDLVAKVWPNFIKLGPSFIRQDAIRCPDRSLSWALFRKIRAILRNQRI